MNVIIRGANADDYKEVINLYKKFVENEERYKDRDNDSFYEVIKDPKVFLDLAVLNGKIIGFICYLIRNVVRYPRPIIEVEEFFVLEEFRRMKIGEKLMEKAIEYGKKHDCYYIFLASDKQRTTAHEFYKHMNFDEYAYHYKRKP